MHFLGVRTLLSQESMLGKCMVTGKHLCASACCCLQWRKRCGAVISFLYNMEPRLCSTLRYTCKQLLVQPYSCDSTVTNLLPSSRHYLLDLAPLVLCL